MNADVLVVGGGVAGISAASTLAGQGLSVLIVERGERLGGRALELACMATTRCRRCSACLLSDALAELEAHTGVEVRLGAGVESLARTPQGIDVDLLSGAGREQWKVRGAIIATGFDVFDAAQKPFLGHGKIDGVFTTLELDHALRSGEVAGWSSAGSVAFVQCVGSRESREGRGYCSQVCCSVALRLAGRLLHLNPDAEITFYYIDLQLMARNVASYHAELADSIRFVQGVPGEIVRGPDGRPEVRHEARESGATTTGHDRVVLSVGMVPRSATAELAGKLGLRSGTFGFLEPGTAPVLAAGACCFPTDIPSAMDEAREAGLGLARALSEVGHG